MHLVELSLGVSVADAEKVELRFAGDRLTLTFVDWTETPRELVFDRVLAFRWQELAEPGVRDDTAYQVLDSPWLEEQARLQAVNRAAFAHYMVCFNVAGVLDVVSAPLGKV